METKRRCLRPRVPRFPLTFPLLKSEGKEETPKDTDTNVDLTRSVEVFSVEGGTNERVNTRVTDPGRRCEDRDDVNMNSKDLWEIHRL